MTKAPNKNKKAQLTLNISVFIIFSVVLFIFIKIMMNSTIIQSQMTSHRDYEFYPADHQPIKIYPKAKKNSYLKSNQRVYDFINKESWEFKPTIQNQKNNKKTPKRELKSEQNNSKKNSTGDIIKYKNHKIHIVSPPDKKTKPIKSSDIAVQLGAFNAYDKAISEQKRIIRLFPDITKKYQFNIEKAHIKQKGIIYRLRVKSFNSTVSAKNFCTNIRKKDIGCFFTSN